jgi:hypothetical protein
MKAIKSKSKEKIQKIMIKHSTVLLSSSKEKEILDEYFIKENNSVKA